MSMGSPNLPPAAPAPPNPASSADPAALLASRNVAGQSMRGLSSTYMTTGAQGDTSAAPARKTLLGQ